MDFIDYCLSTKNYSAIKAVRNFAQVEVKPHHLLAGAAGIGLLYKLGKRSGRKETEDAYESNLRGIANHGDGKISLTNDNIDRLSHDYDDEDDYEDFYDDGE